MAGVTFARSAHAELESRIRLRWGDRAISWPNSVCTFDELHRQLLRYLVHHSHVQWPSGEFPCRIDDSWQDHPGSTGKPGSATRYMLTLDDEGNVCTSPTSSDRVAPKPCFTDAKKLWGAVRAGYCTHAEIRSVLGSAMRAGAYPILRAAVSSCLLSSYCHFIVDESFDMNWLDAFVVECAIEAGMTVTLVGDPWQSLYEFRGASPQRVRALITRHRFQRIDMPGAFRYKTAEMKRLAKRLFDEKPFQVAQAENGDEFDVVLAHDWNTLWDEPRIAVLPVGRPSGLDGSEIANCLVLLLNEVVRQYFRRDAAGVAEARRKLGVDTCEGRIDEALEALRDASADIGDVWSALEAAFKPSDTKWSTKGRRATTYMLRLRELSVLGEPPAIGLTIHQSKGLEWDRVLLLNGELTTDPELWNRIKQEHESHRSVYVGLTRARSTLRVLPVKVNPHSKTPPTPIDWVRPPQQRPVR